MSKQALTRSNLRAIGITGSYGGINVGDEAILTAAIAQLREEAPEAKITVFSRDVDHTSLHHEVDRVADARDAVREELSAELERLDLLLLGGGGILYDREAASYLHVVRLAQELKVPSATFATGVGPLERPSEQETVAEILNRMCVITVRETSAKRLLEEIGVESDVVVTADPALLLEPLPFSERMLKEEGIDKQRPLIGMSVREPGKAASELQEKDYLRLLADAAEFMAERYDANILFVPMEQVDLRESHKVIGEMAHPERAFVLRGPYAPREVLGLMSHLELAVGMRLHFLIFAALQKVPLLALPYASKVSGFLEALGLPQPEELHQEHAGILIAAVDRLWDSRHQQRDLLDERLPEIRERAANTARICLDSPFDEAAARETRPRRRGREESHTAPAQA